MNYEQFRKLAKPVNSLAPYNGDMEEYDFPGYVFEDATGCYAQIEVDEGAGRGPDTYHVLAERSEIHTDDFEVACRWVWDNWAKYQFDEINAL